MKLSINFAVKNAKQFIVGSIDNYGFKTTEREFEKSDSRQDTLPKNRNKTKIAL